MITHNKPYLGQGRSQNTFVIKAGSDDLKHLKYCAICKHFTQNAIDDSKGLCGLEIKTYWDFSCWDFKETRGRK